MQNISLRIVLVETSHPGNIGSAARAMKTMDLTELYLVNPKSFPHPDAIALAAQATDILENAKICSSYLEAIKDCNLVLGTGSFLRDREWPVYTPKQAAELIVSQGNNQKVAIVFGREKNGLTNEELDLCHAQIQIPASNEYNSLNLAASVQIICYEFYQAFHNISFRSVQEDRINVDDKERMLQLLEEILTLTGLYKKENPRLLFHKIRCLMNSGLTKKNKHLVIGILKNIRNALQINKK